MRESAGGSVEGRLPLPPPAAASSPACLRPGRPPQTATGESLTERCGGGPRAEAAGGTGGDFAPQSVNVGSICDPEDMARSAINQAALARIERQFDQAAALGHDARQMVNRNSAPGVQGGAYAGCSCGWLASPRRRRAVAASAAYFHVVEVLQARDSGTLERLDWSPAPVTKKLRGATRENVQAAAS